MFVRILNAHMKDAHDIGGPDNDFAKPFGFALGVDAV